MEKMPRKAGIYWGKEKKDGKWNQIVIIEGSEPFLHIPYIFYLDKEGDTQIDAIPEDVKEWGPEIGVPK
jgi:hypothetical protein